jgi:hypothetical protein
MWGTAEAADAQGDFDFSGAEILKYFFMVVGWRGEADDAAPLRAEARADDAVSFFPQAGDEEIGEGFDPHGDLLDADGLDHLQTGTEGH